MIESDAARAEFRRGLGESFPIVIGLTAIGFIFGALARAAGLTWVEAGLMSAIVYAGPAQLIAVGLMKQGAGFVLIVLGLGRRFGPRLVVPVVLVVLVFTFGVTRIIIAINVLGIELVIPWAFGKFFGELLGHFFASVFFIAHRGSVMQ